MPGPAVTRAVGRAEKRIQRQLADRPPAHRSAGAPAKIRTVGLTEALSRIGRFVRSKAAKDDLQTLVDIPNSIVHAAQDTEVEERILTAFVQMVDSLLADLEQERGDFWDGQLSVVDALLRDDASARRIE
jgi:hypothetical protein